MRGMIYLLFWMAVGCAIGLAALLATYPIYLIIKL
jgi:hypothetical protein